MTITNKSVGFSLIVFSLVAKHVCTLSYNKYSSPFKELGIQSRHIPKLIMYIDKVEIPKFYWVNTVFALLLHVCQY